MSASPEPKCKKLVLDAGPLLSLSPLRGLAKTFFTVPQVLSELKDSRAREHFERLGLMSGVKVEVRSPDAASLSHVIQWAKKTGDYSVLSHADLCVLALTYILDLEDKKDFRGQTEVNRNGDSTPETGPKSSEEPSATVTVEDITDQLDSTSLGNLYEAGDHEDESPPRSETDPDHVEKGHWAEGDVEHSPLEFSDVGSTVVTNDKPTNTPTQGPSCTPIYDNPSDEDDGEGEWITPSNVAIHKSRAMEMLPDDGLEGKKVGPISTGCMTADFAMQNVLLQMRLNLVGLEGKKIQKIKTWVLRCHACFKICKDNSKKFCPSCGNPTLLRASVTVVAPGASPNAQPMQVHLKRNFQYKLRGTKYSIPSPKPGSAKTGSSTGLILREDQLEYMRAKKQADGKRAREERRLLKNILSRESESKGTNTAVNSWMDPDWIPEMMSVGAGGKGRKMKDSRMDGDMPQVGYGRKNPNEKSRTKTGR